jgi:hypothetical protein
VAIKNCKGTDRKKLVREARKAWRGGVGGVRSGERSFDDLFILGPEDAPEVEEHDDAEAADREPMVVVLDPPGSARNCDQYFVPCVNREPVLRLPFFPEEISPTSTVGPFCSAKSLPYFPNITVVEKWDAAAM